MRLGIIALCLFRSWFRYLNVHEPFLYFLQVAVFAGGVDTTATETKGTVLIHSAEQVSFLTV